MALTGQNTIANDKPTRLQYEKLEQEKVFILLEETKDDFPSAEDDFRKNFAKKLSEHASFITLNDESGMIVGVIAFYENRLPDAYISHVWVSKNYRRKGFCSSMLVYLHTHLKATGFKTIRLEVHKENLPALTTYSKEGYKVISESGTDKLLMEKLLG